MHFIFYLPEGMVETTSRLSERQSEDIARHGRLLVSRLRLSDAWERLRRLKDVPISDSELAQLQAKLGKLSMDDKLRAVQIIGRCLGHADVLSSNEVSVPIERLHNATLRELHALVTRPKTYVQLELRGEIDGTIKVLERQFWKERLTVDPDYVANIDELLS